MSKPRSFMTYRFPLPKTERDTIREIWSVLNMPQGTTETTQQMWARRGKIAHSTLCEMEPDLTAENL